MADKCYDIAFSEPLWTLEGSAYLAVRGRPIIYLWKRGDEVLYVGLSATALHRIGGHNVIGKAHPVLDGDTFEFYDPGTRDWLEAAKIEQELILEIRPLYNRTQPAAGTEVGQIACLTCQKPFVQKRAWQRWCSRACRQGRSKTAAAA